MEPTMILGLVAAGLVGAKVMYDQGMLGPATRPAVAGNLEISNLDMTYQAGKIVVGCDVQSNVNEPVAAYIAIGAVVPLSRGVDASRQETVTFIAAEKNKVVFGPGEIKHVGVSLSGTPEMYETVKRGGFGATRLVCAAWSGYAVGDEGLLMSGPVDRMEIELL